MEQKECRTCWVCADGIKSGFLCERHRKKYIYYKKYNMVVLKPRKKVSEGQTMVFRTVRDVVNGCVFKEPVFQEIVFPFLLYRRFDIAVPGKKLIIEYDGRQHFQFNKMMHKTKQKFEEYKRNDRIKEAIAKENGWRVVRFNYKQLEDDNYVRQEIKRIAND